MGSGIFCNCVNCPTRSKSVMNDIPDELLQDLESIKVTNIYKKGQTIFYEGNKPYGVYCLKSGNVKLYKTNTEGKTFITNVTGGGSLLGYRYFFTNELYSASSEAIEDTVVCFIDKERFFDLLKKYPPFSLKLLKMMGEEIRSSEKSVASMAYSSTNERIAAMLLQLKEAYGVKHDDDTYKIDVQLSRNDLASLAGTTTETIVRALSWLKEKELVKTVNKYIHITDLKSLEQMVPEF